MENSKFECRVCMENPEEPVITRCGHFFCKQCIDRWTTQNRAKLTCPVCKAGIEEENLIKMKGKGEKRDVKEERKEEKRDESRETRIQSGDSMSTIIKGLILTIFFLIFYTIIFGRRKIEL